MGNENDAATNDAERNNSAHRLFAQELDLVEIIASRILRAVGRLADREELAAAGREGLLDAAMRFDPSRGVPFRAYANIRIQGSIIDSIRKSATLPRRAYERLRTLEATNITNAGAADSAAAHSPAGADEATLEDTLATQLSAGVAAMLLSVASTDGFGGSSDPESDLSRNPEDAAQRAELVRALHAGIATLDDDEATMIRMSYFEGMSTRRIARELNVSDSWCFRLLKSGTMRLAKYMQAHT